MSPRLAISNLAWGRESHHAVLRLLAENGISGVEMAPTRIADWPDLTTENLRAYRQRVESEGLEISSLQAIFFSRPDAQLFGDAASFAACLDHLRRVTDIATVLNARVAVFGAPRNRNRGSLPVSDARKLAIDRVGQMGEITIAGQLVLGLEPIPAGYGGDFLTNAEEVIEFVRDLNHPGVKVHLDTGCAMIGGDDIGSAIRGSRALLAHFHVSEPMLGGFDKPVAPHKAAADALKKIEYDRWIAIEMKEAVPEPIPAITRAIQFARRIYLTERNGSVGG
jgi:sugar phosphate isomerase/epimerase